MYISVYIVSRLTKVYNSVVIIVLRRLTTLVSSYLGLRNFRFVSSLSNIQCHKSTNISWRVTHKEGIPQLKEYTVLSPVFGGI